MTKIVDFDETLGHITVEPGVTFEQVQSYLERRGSKRILNRVSASAKVSLVGNALERGTGRGTHGDRAATACGLEVVIGDGRILRTGFARFPKAKSAPLYTSGVGPSLDGLFFQSNLGVVTRMTFWLPNAPADFDAVVIGAQNLSQLSRAIDATRQLFAAGVLRPMGRLANASRVLSTLVEQYPDRVAYRRKQSRSLIYGGIEVAPWSIQAFIHYADPGLRDVTRDLVRRAFQASRARVAFNAAADHADVRDLLTGWLQYDDVRSAYWAKSGRAPERASPEADRCGILTVRPIVPFTGKDVVEAIRTMESVYTAYEFEPMIGFSIANERTISGASFIFYDREDGASERRSRRCVDRLNRQLIANGFYPGRLGVEAMDVLPRAWGDYARVRRELKRLFDPNGVLAPGRYEV